MAIQEPRSTLTFPDADESTPPGQPIIQPKAQTSKGMVVVLNGFPGTGKFTIMQHIQARLPAERTRLIDNHLLIDPVHALIPDRSDEHYTLRRLLREVYFQEVKRLVQKGFIILMTACLAEAIPRDAACLQEHLDLVRGTDKPIFWINSYCQPEELERRVGTPERRYGSKAKLTDPDELKVLVEKFNLIKPHNGGDESMRLVVGVLDASGSAADSADLVMQMIRARRSTADRSDGRGLRRMNEN